MGVLLVPDVDEKTLHSLALEAQKLGITRDGLVRRELDECARRSGFPPLDPVEVAALLRWMRERMSSEVMAGA